MGKYIIKRLIQMIPVVIGVSFLVFIILYLSPGEPARMVLGDHATNADVAAFNHKYGLDQPVLIQYGKYMWKVFTRLDFGDSYMTGKPVTSEIFARFPKTFSLAIAITIIASVVGILLGVLAGLHRNSFIDQICQIFAVIGVSIPEFWLGLLLILLFAVKLRWFPVSGYYGVRYVVLPAMTVGLICSASTMRITRSAVLDSVNEDYIKTVMAKGQRNSVVIWKHIFMNALIPIVTNIGTQFASVLSGTITTETVFAIPGLGKMLRDALTNRDYPEIRATVIVLAILVCVVNLLVDLIYTAIDPRIREEFIGLKKITKRSLISSHGINTDNINPQKATQTRGLRDGKDSRKGQ